MSGHQRSGLKFGIFAIVMALLTASLFVTSTSSATAISS
jgi:hypothetical protein